MIYLKDNPLLKQPLHPDHIKNRLLGQWGSSPGLAFIYTHLNRAIREFDQSMIFLAGPGHGAPGVLGPVYLEGTTPKSAPSNPKTKPASSTSSIEEESFQQVDHTPGLREALNRFQIPLAERMPALER